MSDDDREAPSAPRKGSRSYVGPAAEYDLLAGLQFTVLFTLGLRGEHRLLDVGCGSLRGGRLFIPYLQADRYFGVEPNQWLVKEGIAEHLGEELVALKRPRFAFVDDFSFDSFGTQFDFVLAQSIFSHTHTDLAMPALRNIAAVLADGGTFVGTFCCRRPLLRANKHLPHGDAGHGWVYPTCVSFSVAEMAQMLTDVGLKGRVMPLHHPRQTWFAAVKAEDAGRLDDLAHRARRQWHASGFPRLALKESRRFVSSVGKRFAR